jgi:hypothetical protein
MTTTKKLNQYHPDVIAKHAAEAQAKMEAEQMAKA